MTAHLEKVMYHFIQVSAHNEHEPIYLTWLKDKYRWKHISRLLKG